MTSTQVGVHLMGARAGFGLAQTRVLVMGVRPNHVAILLLASHVSFSKGDENKRDNIGRMASIISGQK